MAEIIPFNTSAQVTEILAGQGEIGTYGDLALALQNNPGWRVIEGGKTITNPVEGGSDVIPISNYIKPTPSLEGGAVGATEAIEITAGAETVTASSSGLFAGWTLGTAVAGVLAGTGVGIAAYDLAPEFWIGLSNRLFGTQIAYEDIKDYRITGLIKDELLSGQHQNTTYLPYNVIAEILQYCSNYGLFDNSADGELDDDYENNHQYTVTFGAVDDCIDSWFSRFVRINSDNYSQAFINFTSNMALIAQTLKNLKESYNGVIINFQGSYSPNPYELAAIFMDVYFFNIASTITTTFTNMKEYLQCKGFQLSGGLPAAAKHVRVYVSSSSPTPEYTVDTAGWGSAYTGFYAGDYPLTNPLIHSLNTSNIAMEYEVITQPGIYELPDGQVYDPTRTLPQQYPDWYNRLINTSGLKLPYDDPELYPIPWLPTVMPDYDPITQPEKYPTPSPSPEPAPSPYPAQQPQPWAQTGKMPQQLPDPYPDPNPTPDTTKNPRTGEDSPVDNTPSVNPTPTPPIVFPTVGGEANAIFTVYNPTLAQLNSLAGVLWSANFLDNLIKIFTNNPMDAIISLHMLYATPTTGSSKQIVLGCYPTGVSALEVTKQYLEIDCGTVRIPEYFGDARDYVNTVVDVYLPFVGMRHLKTQDIIGSYVTIKACVDVFTGTILYTINIRKTSGINQVMYAIEGNCAVQLPLTGADKSRMFSVLGAAATGAAVGGVAGAIGGAALSAMNGSAQADVQRSGNFGSNAGAMGVKKPYIVVSRNIGYDANNYNKYHGFPANVTVKLGQCSGYTKVLDCHLTNIDRATDSELQEIERLLKTGVIL